ncbi:MAG TPA: SRPBCC family protein [Baekduia sp.]|nr:SRPBCC family protein [Baekduia sp.]
MTATLHHGDDGRSTLRFERRLGHDPERVWRAITDPAELRAWFPAEVIYERRAGAPMQFDFGGIHGQDVWPGEVLEWDPPRVFAFAWGEDVLRFELSGEAATGPTTLVFTHSFAHEPGKPARDAAGWEACFEAFAALLDATPAADAQDSWSRHHETYLAKFGDLAIEADGTPRVVRLQGPLRELEGRPAVAVELAEAAPAVLVVRDAGGELVDGAVVEVRAGTFDEPGSVVLAGVLHDPLATS